MSETIVGEPIGDDRDVMTQEPDERFFVVVRHKPAAPDDPIPWLATIYRGVAVEAYWRGTPDQASEALADYFNEHGRD